MSDRARHRAIVVQAAPLSRGRARAHRALRLLVAVLVGILLLVPAVKYWIAPALLRAGVQRRLPHYWTGRLDLQDVAIDLTGRIRLSGLTLRDGSNRVWARLDSATLSLDRWPGFDPVLATATLNGLAVEPHFFDGTCTPPVRNLPDLVRWLDERTEARRIRVRDGAIVVHRHSSAVARESPPSLAASPGSETFLWDDIRFTCLRNGSGRNYRFELTRESGGAQGPACRGEVTFRGVLVSLTDRPLAHAGKVQLRDMDAAALIASAGLDPPEGLDTLDFHYRFAGRGLEVTELVGVGELRFSPPPPLLWLLRVALSPSASLFARLGPCWPVSPGHFRFGPAPVEVAAPLDSTSRSPRAFDAYEGSGMPAKPQPMTTPPR